MTRRKNLQKTNGHAGPHGRANDHGDRKAVNGHGSASMERGEVPAHQDLAASDDASGASVAHAATSRAAVPPACRQARPRRASTDLEACAEAAPPPPNGAAQHLSNENDTGTEKGSEHGEVPGQYPLPDDPAEFVEEIHYRIDLFEVWQSLLESKDEKIKQRAVERLTDLLYKGSASLAEEPQQLVMDIDSAVARRAAQGAKK